MKAWLTWLRQLICIHGPLRPVDIGYGYDHVCVRCGHVVVRERAG